MIYDRPWGQTVSHVAIGFVAAWVPWVGMLAIAYQVAQYIFQVRVFAWEGEIRSGNSWQHTALKLAEVGVGQAMGVAFQTSGGSSPAMRPPVPSPLPN